MQSRYLFWNYIYAEVDHSHQIARNRLGLNDAAHQLAIVEAAKERELKEKEKREAEKREKKGKTKRS